MNVQKRKMCASGIVYIKYIFNILSIYVQNILNIYSIYEYNIPFKKHYKKILRNGFLQNDGNGTSEISRVFATDRAGQTP